MAEPINSQNDINTPDISTSMDHTPKSISSATWIMVAGAAVLILLAILMMGGFFSSLNDEDRGGPDTPATRTGP